MKQRLALLIKRLITLSMLILLSCTSSTVTVLAQTAPEPAASNGIKSYSELELRRLHIYFLGNNNFQSCQAAPVSTAAPAAQTLPDSVPQPYRDLFPRAAAANGHNTDPFLLTVIFMSEHGNSFPNPPPPYGTGPMWRSSPAGAKGPFQFLDNTWNRYGEDGSTPPNGTKDVMDLADASYGAANFLRSMGGVNGTPLGHPDNPYQQGTLVYIMAAYNFGPGNMARKKPLPAETRQYIQRGYENYLRLKGQPAGTSGGSSTTTTNTTCSPTGVPAGSFVFYSQFDPRWANHPYGDSTIAKSGCGPAALAMVVATLKDNSVTPIHTADFGTQNGAYDPAIQGSNLQKILIDGPRNWGLKAESLSLDINRAKQVLAAGGLVFAAGRGSVPYTAEGHIIVIRGVTAQGKYLVGDSAHPEANNMEFTEAQIAQNLTGLYGVTR